MRGRWLLPIVSLVSAGCSWSRFDDLQEDTPVVALNKPDSLKSGFGVTIAAVTPAAERSHILIGGSPGKSRAAIFNMGAADKPQVSAVDTGSCSQESHDCYFATKVAGLGRALTGVDVLDDCFALGIGRTDSADWGVIARCEDDTEYILPVPATAKKRLIEDAILFNDVAEPFFLATDKALAPALVAGAPNQNLAWFYGPESLTAVELVPPVDRGESFGAAVASLRLGDSDSRLLAVGAPDASRVWLFRSDDGSSVATVGCLGGPTAFGRTITSGHVDGDEFDDLVVADETNVSVFSGAALDLLQPAVGIDCSLAAMPPDAVIASFRCSSRESIVGCPGGFADALDVGDLDGDGDGEVLVGAPEMTAREERKAGAVLVYDVEDRTELLTDMLFWTSAETDDRLGASVVAVPIEGRDVVVAGAPGNGRAAVFYCPSFVDPATLGGRCQ